MNRRRFLASLVTGAVAVGAQSASAQIMPTQGIPLPVFRSRSENLARDACRENRPECRASVRAQMEFERSITVILPWATLGIAIIAILFWLRAQEKKKEQHRIRARRRHDPAHSAIWTRRRPTGTARPWMRTNFRFSSGGP